MKVILFSLFFFVFSCQDKERSSDDVPIRMDITDPDFKDTTFYYLELQTWDSTKWYLVLGGETSFLKTSEFEGDTVVSLAKGQLAVDQNEDFKILSYNKEIFEIDSGLFIPKKNGESIFIYETPQGIDTALVEIDKNLIPKLSTF